MAKLVTSIIMAEVFDKWHGNYRGGNMTLEALSAEYDLKVSTLKLMVRYRPPYEKFLTVDIAKEIKRIKAIDARTVGQIEKAYLKEIQIKNGTEEEKEESLEGKLREFTIYYIGAFTDKYVDVFKDDFKSKGISVPVLSNAIEYSITNKLIEYNDITVNENGSYSGSHVSILYKILTDEYGLSDEHLWAQTILQIDWALRRPDVRWSGIVTKFIRKDRGHDWYTGKKTQIFNQWEFNAELEELLQIEPIYKY